MSLGKWIFRPALCDAKTETPGGRVGVYIIPIMGIISPELTTPLTEGVDSEVTSNDCICTDLTTPLTGGMFPLHIWQLT